MKFKQYLSEGRSKDIDTYKGIELLKKECSDAYNTYKRNGKVILRGFRSSMNIKTINSENAKLRKSANTDNYYTLLFSNILDSWKKYPKRNKSIICSTNPGNASAYGEIHYVFPYNGTKIGICPDDDLWVSFDISLPIFNNWVKESKKFVDYWNQRNQEKSNVTKMLDTNPKKLKEFFDYLTKNLKEDDQFEDYYFANDQYSFNQINMEFQSFYNHIDEYSSIIDYFDKTIFNPDKNGFKLIDTKQINKLPTADREVWFSGKAILVPEFYTDSDSDWDI